MCGSFCSYFAHLIYDKSFNGVASELVYINDHVLKRFLIRMLSHYLIIFLWLICQFSISFWTLYFLIIENFTRFLNESQLCVTIKVKNTKSIYGGIHHTSNWILLSVQFPDEFRNAAFRSEFSSSRNSRTFFSFQFFSNKLGKISDNICTQKQTEHTQYSNVS